MNVKSLLEQEIEELLNKAYRQRVNNLSESIILAQRALEMSRNSSPYLNAKAINLLSLFCMIRGEFERSIVLAEEALAYFQSVDDTKGVADAKYNIGSVFYKTNNFHFGLHYLLECLQLYREVNDFHNEARVLKAMGTIYEYFGDQKRAMDSYESCILAAQKVNDLNQISNAYNPLSGIYLKQGLIEKAVDIIEKSIHIKTETGDTRGFAFAIYGRGKVYLHQKRYPEALKDLQESLSLHQKMGEKLGEGMAYNKIGMVYMGMKEYTKADECFANSMQVAQQYNIQFILFRAHYNRYLLAREQENIQDALRYLEIYMKLKEAVINSHTYDVIKSYESISKIETLEQEAKTQKEKAVIIEKKNAELDSFFYRISHDLKGPISSLLGLHNLVKLEVEDPASLYYFNLYQSQIQRINNIVMDLINLTRMNHAAETKTRIDFNLLVDECIHSYSYLDNFKAINFVKQIDNNLVYNSIWAIVNTILQNLIENAIKYARIDAHPYVKIFVGQVNDKVKIEVEDNGQGIRVDDQSKIFNMFFRANDRVKGTGLGLYILKRAVERLGGEISFESQVNVGSTFSILLPTQLDIVG